VIYQFAVAIWKQRLDRPVPFFVPQHLMPAVWTNLEIANIHKDRNLPAASAAISFTNPFPDINRSDLFHLFPLL
jgi:hypothetical protein